MDGGQTEVDVVCCDLELTQEKALNLALNKIKGTWDAELLAELMADLVLTDIDPALTGFDETEIGDLVLANDIAISESEYAELLRPAVKRNVDKSDEDERTITLTATPSAYKTGGWPNIWRRALTC